VLPFSNIIILIAISHSFSASRHRPDATAFPPLARLSNGDSRYSPKVLIPPDPYRAIPAAFSVCVCRPAAPAAAIPLVDRIFGCRFSYHACLFNLERLLDLVWFSL
jgi:hypothetical protein